MMSAIDVGEVITLIKTMTPGVSDEAVSEAVSDWITAHPEAVTTVTDGSITEQKLASALATKINQSATAVSTLSDEIVQLTGDVTKLDYDVDVIYGSGWYTDNGALKYASYPDKRIRLNRPIMLKVGDIIEFEMGKNYQCVIVYSADGTTYTGDIWGSPYIATVSGIYYITMKFADNSALTETIARDMIAGLSFLRGTGNYALRNGEQWAYESAGNDHINFFDDTRLINARINLSTGEIVVDASHRLAWCKLQPDTVYNIRMIKALNQSIQFALFDHGPVFGSVGVNAFEAEYNNSTLERTIKTTATHFYLAIKYYLATSSATYTQYEVLNSITINKCVGGIDADAIRKTENARHIKGNTGNALTIVHFSDIHANANALRRIMAGVGKLGEMVDDSICTGDISGDAYAEIASWWNPAVLTCIGNHDSASYSGETYNWTALSMADRDAYYIAPFESNWGIVHTAGTSYYYKDYTEKNVRLIVMDAMLYTNAGTEATTQTAWLEGLLADAITNNLHVLIAIHAPHGGAVAEECSFSRYGQTAMPTYTDCNTPQTVIDAVATAIGNGLHFVGYLVGHAHQDNIWDAENNGKQMMYCVTCASTTPNQWATSDQYRGMDADAYNIVTIDTANTLVKIVRCGGADIDDHMRTRKAICFNYSTGEKVGEIL